MMTLPLSIPEDKERIFRELPHINPFFDIAKAIKFVVPLNTSYSSQLEKNQQVKIIQNAFHFLITRQEADFVKSFHRLSEEFLKEYRNHFPDERIKELVSRLKSRESAERESLDLSGIHVREAILKQDRITDLYFKNFYLMSLQYLYTVEENGTRAPNPKKPL